jgi:hypothetical protein
LTTLYANSRFRVVNDGAPGLKIYDVVLGRVNLRRFGAFYDRMGAPYHDDSLTAAKAVADAADAADAARYKERIAARAAQR